jgi:hypothetical protein
MDPVLKAAGDREKYLSTIRESLEAEMKAHSCQNTGHKGKPNIQTHLADRASSPERAGM